MAIVSHDGHNSETTTEPSHLVERKEGVSFTKLVLQLCRL